MIDLWQEIYGTIKRNKLRTFLTGFAVAWGIFMLIVLLGAGNGLIHAFEENSGERALNSIRVYGGWTTKPYDGLKEGRSIDLDNRDLEDTEAFFTDRVEGAGATLYQAATDISYGPEYVNLSLNGVHPNYVEVEAVKVVEGRFINQTDIRERRKSIVLHRKSADVLFGKTHTEPLGRFVNAGGVAYQVVGIYDDEGSSEPNSAFIPFSTLQTIYNKGNRLNSIIFTTKGLTTEASNEQFEADYRRVIGAVRGGLPPRHRREPPLRPHGRRRHLAVEPLHQLPASHGRHGHPAHGHLGHRHLHVAERHRGRQQHHAHHRPRTHPRVRHPQGAGREAPQHLVADYRGERGHHHPVRLRGHGGRHRGDGVDGRGLRQPAGGALPGAQGHPHTAHRGVEGGVR